MSDVTQPPKIDRLPEAPNRQSARPDFVVKADAFVAAQDPWGQQVNVLADWMEGIGRLVMQYAQEGEQWNTATEIAKDKAEAAAVSADRSEKSAQKHLDDVEKLIQGFDPTGSGLPVVTKPDAPLVVATKNGGVRFSDRALNNGVDVRPKLRLDFINQKHLDPRATFTRSTPDWDWDGKRYEANELVLSDEGLWLWSARTNLLTHSWDFGNAAWQKSEGATAENKDGYFTVIHGGTGTAYTIRTAITESSGVVFSTEVRAFVDFRIRVGVGVDQTVIFDADMNVVSKGSSVKSVKVVPRGAFSRIELAFDAVPQGYVTFLPVDLNYSGMVLDIKYAQLEKGGVATPHIPTDGAQVTVGASTLEVLGDSFKKMFNPWCGSLVFKVGVNTLRGASSGPPYINVGILGDRNTNQTGVLGVLGSSFTYRNSSGGSPLYVRVPGSSASAIPYDASGFGVAFSYYGDGAEISGDGDAVRVDWDVSDFIRGSAYRIYVHSYTRGYVRSLSYYDRALTDEQLQELTK